MFNHTNSLPAWLLFLLVLTAVSCKQAQTIDNMEIMAKVKDKTLTRETVLSIIPKGVSSADSFLIAESYIKKWAIDELVYVQALRNLGPEKEEIDKLVETYRSSLFRYRYLEDLIKRRVSADISDSEKLRFYSENEDKFTLDAGIIKGLFLKIPVNAPKLHEIKELYNLNTDEALAGIEQYSVQNAISYDYFYDKWIDFDEVISQIPFRVADASTFLRNHKSLEVSDSSYCYLLNIKEFIAPGRIAPYEYAEPQVVEMLINLKKASFLKNFENELLEDAVKNGDVLFNENESHTNENQ
ncbi:MAG: peptidyl-prolyl cis-trans isomerase [Tannerellaceae bacterium]|nr:peptidyl-prolyl cis-trans isomerase [Tannerellaceae bacterium]